MLSGDWFMAGFIFAVLLMFGIEELLRRLDPDD